MGMFDFITDAGEKLGGKVADVMQKGEDVNKPVEISPERLNELRRVNIERTISELAIEVRDLKITVDGSTAVLAGTVADQPTCEKLVLTAGNQFGIAKVDCQLTVSEPAPEANLYTVQSGDTLGKIAKEQYGNAGKYPVIFEANKPMLTDPDKIYPGQVLRIPAL